MKLLWGIIVFGSLAWYAAISVYIAIKGSMDIKTMLAHLKHGSEDDR